MDRLTYNQTKKLVERGILEVNGSHLIIDKISISDVDEYVIDEIFNLKNTIKFKVSSIREIKSFIINYNQIKKIGDMDINNILEAYDMGSNSIIEIDCETNVENDIIGKADAIVDGYELYDNMRIIFKNDINEKYCNKLFKIKTVNGVITLVANRGRPKKIKK